MKDMQKRKRMSSVCKCLTIGVALMSVNLMGCPEANMPTTVPCATATITGTSADANNNPDFSPFDASQCTVTLADGVLEIDILDRTVSGTIPRALFTLSTTASSVSELSGDIDLARTDDVEPEPAIYQEWVEGTDPAEGSFWTSNSGTITFAADAEGNVTATFNFNADNPSTVDNDALGTLSVSGTVRVFTIEVSEDTPCGLGATSASMMMLLGLTLMSVHRRYRKRTL